MTLRPPGGSVKLTSTSTKLTNLVSLEQSHHKSTGMYGGGLIKLAIGGKLGRLLSSLGAVCTF